MGDISIKGRSPLLKGGRVGKKSGGRIGLKHGKVPFWKFWGGAQKKIEERKYKTIEGMQGSGLNITDEQKKYLETHKIKPKKEPVKEAQGGNK